MREASGVAEFLNEVARQFCQGNIDLRAAAEMRQCALAVLRTFEFEARNQREATRTAAPRTSSGKKLPFPFQVNVRDILTGEPYQSPNRKGNSAAQPPSPPGQQDPKEDKPDQDRQQSVSPASAPGAQTQAKDQAKAQPPAKAQQQNEQNKPQLDDQNKPKPNDQNKPPQNDQNKPQANGHSALIPAPPAAQPVAPAPKENQPVQYPPGLGPRYVQVATPEMPWWRRPQFGNPGFVTGTVPKAAAMPVPRFRGTRR